MSTATINQTEIVSVLRKVLHDYNYVLAISSKIQFELQLSHREMWAGLCWHLKHKHPFLAVSILDELSKDAGVDLKNKQFCEWANNFESPHDMRKKALAPRIALLMKTIERLNATA